ncbi:unnamed protein product [Linum tenue]|uniref:Uncharacterized protein n=1 Tax=Linum tenue TaxID=586396 RepID=A0AAV0NXJ2_9ROSI|nr:unnamed protein product [Linum tenue]
MDLLSCPPLHSSGPSPRLILDEDGEGSPEKGASAASTAAGDKVVGDFNCRRR